MIYRRIFRVLALVSTGVASMVPHGEAKAESMKRSKKSGPEKVAHSRGTGSNNAESRGADPGILASGILDSGTTPKMAVPDDFQYKKPATTLDPALMASAERSTPDTANLVPKSFETPFDEVEVGTMEQTRYPWKRQIVTTTFWVGEDSGQNNPVHNHASSWDPKWAKNYGGTDSPNPAKRVNFAPASFTPNQNPFYVALPYNDMSGGKHKPEASTVIPWFYKEYKSPGRSVCKGRWVAIRKGDRVCYAQWEDAGPFRTDHWQYVFGSERPRPNLNRGAGLDVSPAVRDYLGLNSTDVTDWRFVDLDEVPHGPWAALGENNPFVNGTKREGTEVVSNPQPVGAPAL